MATQMEAPPDLDMPQGAKEYQINCDGVLDVGFQCNDSHSRDGKDRWVRISGCTPESPAAQAHVPLGILKKVNRIPVSSKDDVVRALSMPCLPNWVLVTVIPYPFKLEKYMIKVPPPGEGLGLSYSAGPTGLYITSVVSGSAADQARIPVGKRVVKVNTVGFESDTEFNQLVTMCRQHQYKHIQLEVEGEQELPDDMVSERGTTWDEASRHSERHKQDARRPSRLEIHGHNPHSTPMQLPPGARFTGRTAEEKRYSVATSYVGGSVGSKGEVSSPSRRVAPMSTSHGGPDPRDRDGCIWLRLGGEERAFTLPPHHLVQTSGEPTKGLPSVGTHVMIQKLTRPDEMRYNGKVGLVIPPGEVSEYDSNEFTGDETPSEGPSSRERQTEVVRSTPPKTKRKAKILPTPRDNTLVFQSMLSPYGQKPPAQSPQQRRRDWQQWIRQQQAQNVARGEHLYGGPQPPIRIHRPLPTRLPSEGVQTDDLVIDDHLPPMPYDVESDPTPRVPPHRSPVQTVLPTFS